MKPGIYRNISNEYYHSGPGISNSGLWTIRTKSPAHYKFGVRTKKNHFDFGEACHLAILQPDEFEARVYRGPEDRRGNKWKDAAEWCATEGRLILTAGDFDRVLTVRDTVHADQWVNAIITGGEPLIEVSGYFNDAETGELCRIRPDVYRPDLNLVLDVKTTRSAHPDDFARSVVNYGYHQQEAFYSDGLRQLGCTVDAWAFLVFESESPHAVAVYELPPSIVEEGRASYRQALDTYHGCSVADQWTAYGEGVQELSFSRWAYRLTEAPNALDEELAV